MRLAPLAACAIAFASACGFVTEAPAGGSSDASMPPPIPDGGPADATTDTVDGSAADTSAGDAVHGDVSEVGAPDTGCTPGGCGETGYCAGGTCKPGRRVFVSSTQHDGDFGGLDKADAFCAKLAEPLKGTWRAWLSDGTNSPSTRFTKPTVPYVLLDGTQVAASYIALTSGGLDHEIDQDEMGGTNSGAWVWTGTRADGTTDTNTCSGFTSSQSNDYGLFGKAYHQDAGWTYGGADVQCSTGLPVYCFEQ